MHSYVRMCDTGRVKRPIRIMLVDDSAAFLQAVEGVLSRDPTVEVVARCMTGGEAVEQASTMRPDVALIDLTMPGMNGLETTRLLKATAPDLRVILVSFYDSDVVRESARSAGAQAFLPKSRVGMKLPSLLLQLMAPSAA